MNDFWLGFEKQADAGQMAALTGKRLFGTGKKTPVNTFLQEMRAKGTNTLPSHRTLPKVNEAAKKVQKGNWTSGDKDNVIVR
jgi:hypothetical protein